jgi:protocatechuate 3,4-dioxygenase beta subunit
MRLRFALLLFSAVALVTPYSIPAQASDSSHAQNRAASAQGGAVIRGNVYDPDARAVPGARVSLLDSLNVIAETLTDSHGEYEFTVLRNGAYTIVANAPGFTRLSAGIEVRTGETRAVDLHLRLSAVQQQVVVSASLSGALAPQIGSSVSVVSKREIEERG